MHYLHVYAVELDDFELNQQKKGIIESVRDHTESFLEPERDRLYDWYAIDGGRWENDVFDEIEGNILCCKDDTELFKSTVQRQLSWRYSKLNRVLKSVTKDGYLEKMPSLLEMFAPHEENDFDTFTLADWDKIDLMLHDGDFPMNAWYLKELGEVLNGSLCTEIHFFDTKECSANPRWALERAELCPEKQFLIGVDLHN